ncbi:MAG: hypothetical protein Kow0042_12680 [Calditrichia bacterium]
MMHQNKSSVLFWGIILIIIGFLFLFQNLGLWEVGEIFRTFWPLILIAIGLKILFSKRRAAWYEGTAPSESDTSTTAGKSGDSSPEYQNNIFGDVKMRFDGKEVRRFSVNNVFGDVDLNFLQAKFLEDAYIHVGGIFGDIEIALPPNLNLEVRATCTGGSIRIFEDKHEGLFKNIFYKTPNPPKGAPLVRIHTSLIFGDIRVTH